MSCSAHSFQMTRKKADILETYDQINIDILTVVRGNIINNSVLTLIVVKVLRKTPKDVDEYIAKAPKEVQGKLNEIRAAISETAPSAVESISYRMPYYDYKGRLAWFGLAKAHIGLYLRPPVVEEHKKELANYKTTKSAIHFPLNKKIPVPLIKKLIKARMKKNEDERALIQRRE